MGEAVSRVCQGVCGYQSTQQNKQAQSSIQKKSSLLVQQLKGSETTRNDLEYKNQRDLSPNQQNFKTPLAVAGKFKGRSLSQKNLSLSQSNGNYLQTTGCKEIVSLKENNFTPEDFMTRFQDLHSESSSELSVSERDSEYIFRHLQRISNVSNRNTQFSEAAGGNTKQKKSKKLSILQRGRKSTFNIQEFQGRVEKQFQEKEGLIEGAFKLTAHSIVVRSMSCMSVYNLPSGRINSKYHVFELNRRHSPLIQLMPGRQQAVSAGKDGRIALWDIKAGGRAFSINNIFNFKYSQQCFFTDLAVLSRSSIIVLVQKTAQLMKINVKQGKIQKSTSLAHYFGEQDGLVDIQEEKIPKLYVFKDQFNMLALSGERYAIFIQLRSLKFVKKINFPEQTEVRTLMLMRDTNLLFVGALFDIILISFTTQRVCSTVRAHKSYITCLKELDIKKKLFASGSVDKSVKIWSLVESSCQLILLRTLDAHSTRIDQIMRMDRRTLITIDHYEPDNPYPNIIVWK